MAKTRAGLLGRLLLLVVALVLALPAVAGGAYAASGPAAAKSTARGDAPDDAQWASDASEHQEPGADRCRTRHGGRSTATVSVPVPPRTTVSSAGPLRAEGGPGRTVPLTGRRAVPVWRSGELPVRHLVFRC
ncbi:hypothetical protein [Streptomyces kronopolitis]|uniref:hypothetical protein n=1 Tax=Streptomyces kronopolitis TaxID=1612435 RepID=UPI003D98B3A8